MRQTTVPSLIYRRNDPKGGPPLDVLLRSQRSMVAVAPCVGRRLPRFKLSYRNNVY